MKSLYTPEDLLSKYTDDFYRLTNKTENHRGFQYKTGINTDILPFNPTGICQPGGMYFFHISQIHLFSSYCSGIVWIRKVSFTENSKIYAEHNKFKTNEFILEEKKKFFLDNLSEEICRLAVDLNGYALKYVHEQTEEVCRLAVQENGYALKYVQDQTEEVCTLAVQQNGSALQFVHEQTEEICKLAVQRYGHALSYVKNQTEEVCTLAVQQDGRVLAYVKNQTEEICKLAIQQNSDAISYVKEQFMYLV